MIRTPSCDRLLTRFAAAALMRCLAAGILLFAAFPVLPQSKAEQQGTAAPPVRKRLQRPTADTKGFEQYAGQSADRRLVAAAAGGRGKYPRDREAQRRADARALYFQGQRFLAHRQYARALSALRSAIALDDEFVPAHYSLGLTCSARHDYVCAVHAFNEVVRLLPDSAAAYFNSGVAYAALSDFAKAADYFRQATSLNSGWVEAHYNLGLALSSLGRNAEAIEEFQRAIALRDDYPAAHFRLGLECLTAGNRAAASEQIAILRRLGRRDLARKLSTASARSEH
jgi:tetratricopeptide (TPR) repeat protein